MKQVLARGRLSKPARFSGLSALLYLVIIPFELQPIRLQSLIEGTR